MVKKSLTIFLFIFLPTTVGAYFMGFGFGGFIGDATGTGGGGGAFSPSDISGMKLWLDGSDAATLYTDSSCSTPVSSDGDVVGCWEDKSGNGADLIQATADAKPLYKTAILNGESVVRTDGSNDYLQGTTFSLTTETATVFIAAKKGLLCGGGCGIFSFRNTGTLDYNSVKSLAGWYSGNCSYRNGCLSSQTFPTNGEEFIYVTKFNGTNETSYKNGGAGATPVASTGSFDSTIFTLGRRDTETIFNQIDYAEVIVYDTALSDTDREAVRDYLNTKYALY